MIDLYKGHRTEFLLCEFWSVVGDGLVPPDQICYATKPTGTFFAKEVTPYVSENQDIDNSFLAEQKTVTLETKDNICKVNRNDIVKFNEENYRVDRIQKIPVKKHRQYMIKPSHTYYITLRG